MASSGCIRHAVYRVAYAMQQSIRRASATPHGIRFRRLRAPLFCVEGILVR